MTSVAWLAQASSRLFSLIFPDDCRICQQRLEGYSRVPVCHDCLESPRPLVAEYFCIKCRTPFLRDGMLDEEGYCRLCAGGVTSYDAAYAWGPYDGVLKELIHCFKYQGMRPLTRQLGIYLTEALPRTERLDFIVPMPIHWTRRLTRGFNQCEHLAMELSRRTGLDVVRALAKTRRTPKQANLTSARRRKNVSGAFRVDQPADVKGKRVLLLDDVLTTGSTVNEAAKELKRAGAARVAILTVARVDSRKVRAFQEKFELEPVEEAKQR